MTGRSASCTPLNHITAPSPIMRTRGIIPSLLQHKSKGGKSMTLKSPRLWTLFLILLGLECSKCLKDLKDSKDITRWTSTWTRSEKGSSLLKRVSVFPSVLVHTVTWMRRNRLFNDSIIKAWNFTILDSLVGAKPSSTFYTGFGYGSCSTRVLRRPTTRLPKQIHTGELEPQNCFTYIEEQVGLIPGIKRS